jgi:hypothetical protein
MVFDVIKLVTIIGGSSNGSLMLEGLLLLWVLAATMRVPRA